MKYILKEITPLGGNDLFIANHWPDNQMDFPLHFHEDYEPVSYTHLTLPTNREV